MNSTEEAAHRLLTLASDDVPSGTDLLAGVRAGNRRRTVRLRFAATAGVAATVAVTVATTLALIPAPSAFAQVRKAAATTAATSYGIRAAETIVHLGGLRSQPWATAWGRFDPASGTGEQSDNLGAQIRYTGGYAYIFVTDSLRDGSAAQDQPIPAWASWERLPAAVQPGAPVPTAGLALLGTFPALLGQADPQNLLALLQSATSVRETGPVSGPGWTGTGYAFTASATLTGPLHALVSASGTVDVDQQGLVRRLTAQETGFAQTVRDITISFGDFGAPVSVSPPPASTTWNPPA